MKRSVGRLMVCCLLVKESKVTFVVCWLNGNDRGIMVVVVLYVCVCREVVQNLVCTVVFLLVSAPPDVLRTTLRR